MVNKLKDNIYITITFLYTRNNTSQVKVAQSCLTLCDPMDYTVHGIIQARILDWVGFPFPRDLPNPGIKPRSPTLQVDSLPAQPPGKPKNTGVGSLSLLQRIFLTQELSQGLLHCRRSLYQLSYQERTQINFNFKKESWFLQNDGMTYLWDSDSVCYDQNQG